MRSINLGKVIFRFVQTIHTHNHTNFPLEIYFASLFQTPRQIVVDCHFVTAFYVRDSKKSERFGTSTVIDFVAIHDIGFMTMRQDNILHSVE